MKAIIAALLVVFCSAIVSADAFQSFSAIVNFKTTMKDLIEHPSLIEPSHLYLFDGTISSVRLTASKENQFQAELDFINSEWIGSESIKTYRIKLIMTKPSFEPLFPQKPGQHASPGQIAPNDRALVLVQYSNKITSDTGKETLVFLVHEFRLLR